MKKLLIAAMAATLFTACKKSDTPDTDIQADRTVFVYMAGENNLSTYAEKDLSEMKKGAQSIGSNNNLIVYVDDASSQKPYIARVKDGALRDTTFFSESYSSDPNILQLLLSHVKDTYPAKSYGLVFWGHATGWFIKRDSIAYNSRRRAYGGDTGNNTTTSSGRFWMNIPSMAKAISRAMGSDKLKYIFFDCCNMGCVEVAYELRNVADYMVASPAEIPEEGAPYDIVVPDLFSQSEAFYRNLIDHYYDYYTDKIKAEPGKYFNKVPGDLNGYSVPLVAVKCAETDNLASATSSILLSIADKISADGSGLDQTGVIFYGEADSRPYGYDMRNTFKQNCAQADYDTWMGTYNQAVPYYRTSDRWLTGGYHYLIPAISTFNTAQDNAGCLSMFYPSSTYWGTDPVWNKAIQQMQWNSVIHWEQYGW